MAQPASSFLKTLLAMSIRWKLCVILFEVVTESADIRSIPTYMSKYHCTPLYVHALFLPGWACCLEVLAHSQSRNHLESFSGGSLPLTIVKGQKLAGSQLQCQSHMQ